MEYSAKYRVSISTLRRRIKAGEQEYQFTDGKYVLKDVPPPVSSVSEVIAPPQPVKPQLQKVPDLSKAKTLKIVSTPESSGPEPVAPAVEQLLAEIKKAYMQILQEKEEQILLLRSEVSDLKTLVTVLEEQNNQLKNTDPKFELDLDL
jgi:hypothetical protein